MYDELKKSFPVLISTHTTEIWFESTEKWFELHVLRAFCEPWERNETL